MSAGLRLAIFAVVIAAVAIPLITVGNTVSSINIPAPTPVVTGIGQNPQNPAPATPQPPGQPVSYLTAAGIRMGLAHLAKAVPGARVALVRLDARSLSASARLPRGTFREIVLTPTGSITTTGASTGQRLIPISRVSPRAVARIVAGMKARFHVRVGQIDYMVLSSPPGAATRWIIFAKGPAHPGFSATLAGADLKRLPR